MRLVGYAATTDIHARGACPVSIWNYPTVIVCFHPRLESNQTLNVSTCQTTRAIRTVVLRRMQFTSLYGTHYPRLWTFRSFHINANSLGRIAFTATNHVVVLIGFCRF